MPFIGNQPALSYTSFVKQDFTTSATTSYTLSQPVANENEIALFINFVRQEPTTAYTASGTSLTLTSATSASDDMYAIFLGKAVQTVNPPAGSVGASQIADGSIALGKLSATGTKDSTTFLRGDNTFNTPPLGGITEADLWRLSADTSPVGYITSNWERADTDGQNHLGTGMSESSGVFTFPSTGYYLIMAMGDQKFTGGAHDQADFTIYSTTDGTNYARAAIANGSSATTNYHESTTTTLLFDVTNTSTHKIKFFSAGNWTLRGDTSQNQTHVNFIRLGDT
jgi:hypothetical protein